MPNRPQFVSQEICTSCNHELTKHLRVARDRMFREYRATLDDDEDFDPAAVFATRDNVTFEDCVMVMRNAQRGPKGDTGAKGAMGMQGLPGRDA